MSNLKSSWDIAIAAGEPHSVIRVRNLQAVAIVGTDAWGRIGKEQPILLSAAISLRKPFDQASDEDSVDNNSTIHYGLLSKAILSAGKYAAGRGSLMDFFNKVSGMLYMSYKDERGITIGEGPVLDPKITRSLTVEIMLPKASLIGSGVSLIGTKLFNQDGSVEARSMALKLHDLRISTLIGVNPNERLAKQIVVANVEIDLWRIIYKADYYCQFEELVYKTIEESSFQTLEALATYISKRIIRHFIIPLYNQHSSEIDSRNPNVAERLKISLAKPTAVTFADAPTVEVLVDTSPLNSSARKFWQNQRDAKLPPFPLQGRLDEWIMENCEFDVEPELAPMTLS